MLGLPGPGLQNQEERSDKALNIGLMLIVFLLVVLSVMLFRAWHFRPQAGEKGTAWKEDVPLERGVESLQECIRFQTLSGGESGEFTGLIAYLEKRYPRVHEQLKRTVINGKSLLFHWKGKDSEQKPYLLMGHTDVVPAEQVGLWTHPPFSGVKDQGYIWGRGTLDMKMNIVGILEAAESLLEAGFKPSRDVYLAFGHDEEIRGSEGAVAIATHLKEQGITLDYVLDEGGCVLEEAMQGLSLPLALIGTCEKGFANVKISARSRGGHSSMPPPITPLGQVSIAVARLEKRQLPLRITSPLRSMLHVVGPYMGLGHRFLLANLWLFAPLFKTFFARTPTGNALLRTTTASTMACGSKAANVLPEEAYAVINFRLLPGDDRNSLLGHIEELLKDLDVELKILHLDEPTPVSPVDSQAFSLLRETIGEVFPQALVSPYIVVGGTDASRYQEICSNIYRFSPFQVQREEIGRVHGIDERVSIENLQKAMTFYIRLLQRS